MQQPLDRNRTLGFSTSRHVKQQPTDILAPLPNSQFPAMATSRLTFLYPHLSRAGGRWSEPAAAQSLQAVRTPRRKPSSLSASSACGQHIAPFTAPSAGRQAAFAKRAGKGIEPQPLHNDTPMSAPEPTDTSRKPERARQEGHGAVKTGAPPPPRPSQSPGDSSQQFYSSPPLPPNPPETIELPPPEDIGPVTQTKKGSPMDEILHRERPKRGQSTNPSKEHPPSSPDKPPHLTPPPYIHHFDSYTLVRQLVAGGFTLPQAITSMKAIRTILASNLDVAQAGLVSKADVENETYLFRAACSELSAEVRNNRRVADEQLRQQRTLLQHEVDILAQRLNQELLTLNDNVRGMFNDRRMAVREEQKAVESRIQQINYKISVMLNSDAKSDIEALRWVLIRRSVLGIIFMAVLTLGTLRYATYTSHRRQKEAAERAREAEQAKKHDGRNDMSAAPEAAEILSAS
ncbi:hypothetical protein VTK26DRAFT_5379 [Humicola hyalothermophila]